MKNFVNDKKSKMELFIVSESYFTGLRTELVSEKQNPLNEYA
jgi:hypothetical protein